MCSNIEADCNETFISPKYIIIDKDTGDLTFLPTEEKIYQIPLWVHNGKETTKITISIRAGYDLGSPWSIPPSGTFIPDTDCSMLKNNPSVREYNLFSCEVLSYKARGEYDIAIIEYIAPGTELPKAIGKSYTDYLNDDRDMFELCVLDVKTDECQKNNNNINYQVSVNYLNTFFQQESAKYGVEDFKLNISIHGPYQIQENLYQFNGDSAKIQEYLVNYTEDNRQKLINTDYDFLAFIFIYDYDKYTNYSFVSNTQGHRKSVFVYEGVGEFKYEGVMVNPMPDGGTLVETLIHEVGHLFHAGDKYRLDDNKRTPFFTCTMEGLGDPDRKPLFPQETTDIYCGIVFVKEEDMKIGSQNKESYYASLVGDYPYKKGSYVINRYTAQEIGWVE